MLVVSPFNRREALAKLLDDISIEYLKQEDCESYYISLKDIYYNRKELIKHYESKLFLNSIYNYIINELII